jgi:hypothetical protein
MQAALTEATDTVTLGAMCWQIYFISFASISSFVLFNIMVSVLIVALNQETQVLFFVSARTNKRHHHHPSSAGLVSCQHPRRGSQNVLSLGDTFNSFYHSAPQHTQH